MCPAPDFRLSPSCCRRVGSQAAGGRSVSLAVSEVISKILVELVFYGGRQGSESQGNRDNRGQESQGGVCVLDEAVRREGWGTILNG